MSISGGQQPQGENTPLLKNAQELRVSRKSFDVVNAPAIPQKEEAMMDEPQVHGKMSAVVKFSIAVSCLSSFVLGYDIGVTSGAILFIQSHFGLSDNQSELLVGSLTIAAAFGAAFGGSIADAVGRKKSMIYTSALFLLAAGLMAGGPDYASIMIGRILGGLAIGAGMVISPLYSSEMAPANVRGFLVASAEVFISGGILIGYICNAALANLNPAYNWRIMLAIGGVPPIIILCSLFFMPESPRWLATHGKDAQSLSVLNKIYSNDEATANNVLKLIKQAIEKESVESQSSWKDVFCPGAVFRAMMIVGFGVQFFTQASGIEAVTYYTPSVMKAAGITDKAQQTYMTVIVGVVKLVCVIISTSLFDKLGRKPLLLIGSSGITISLLVLGFASVSNATATLSLVALCVFVGSFAVGYGPASWVLSSEVFPSKVRGRALSLAIFLNRAVGGILASTFLSLTSALTTRGAFIMFALVNLLSIFWILRYVPETKGKTLEQIEQFFFDRVHGEKKPVTSSTPNKATANVV